MTSGCYFCGSTVDIEEHHIVPQRFDGSDKASNTVDLCHDCHWKLERLYNKEFWEAIGVEDPRATQESHITRHVHGCLKPATGRYHVSHHGDAALVYRCDQHAPDSDEDARILEADTAGEEDDPDWLDQLVSEPQRSRGLTPQLEFCLNDVLGGGPLQSAELHDTIAGGRVQELQVVEEDETGRVTGVRVLTGQSRYVARYEGKSEGWVAAFDGVRDGVAE